MRLSLLVVPTLLMACASLVAQPSQPPAPTPSKAIQQKQTAGGNMQAEAESPAARTKNAAPPPNQQLAQAPQSVMREGSAEVQRESPPDWWARIAAILAALAAFGQVWILIRQSGIIERQRKVSREALRTSQAVERAWITLSAMEIRMAPDAETQVTFVWKNTGNTPAFLGNARVVIEAPPRGQSLAMPPDYSDSGDASPPAVLVSGEEASSVVPVSPKLTAKVYNEIQSGDRWMYVYGYIEYRTIFNKTRLNTYRFARRYSPELSRQHKRTMWYYPMAEGYNDAD